MLERAGISVHSNLCTALRLRSSFLEKFYKYGGVITDDHVVLLEKTRQKNQEMITENQKLGEEMKAKDEEHNRVIREVLNELQNMNDDVANRVRPQRQGKKKGKFRYLQHVG